MYKEELPMRTVIENGWILTMDSADTCYENGYIIIEGDRITHVGKVRLRQICRPAPAVSTPAVPSSCQA